MTDVKILKRREIALRKSLYDPFEKSFKGSKAQRKNAEKELRKLQEQIFKLERLRKEDVLEEIASIEKRIKEDLVGFWWEKYPLNYADDLRKRLSSLKASL